MRFNTVVLSFLAALAVSTVAKAGSTGSPVGDWSADWNIAGNDHGTAMVMFSNDFTCTGYGYSEKSFGIFPISGSWTVDPKDRVQASLLFDIGTGGRAISTKIKVVNSNRLVGTGTSPGWHGAKLKGELPSDIPNLSGDWAVQVNQQGVHFMESYTMTASTNLAGVFVITGQGTGPYGSYGMTGELMATPTRHLAGSLLSTYGSSESAVTTTGSVTGRLTGNLKKFSLKGEMNDGRRVVIQAEKL
jgi:hypothetical protein